MPLISSLAAALFRSGTCHFLYFCHINHIFILNTFILLSSERKGVYLSTCAEASSATPQCG